MFMHLTIPKCVLLLITKMSVYSFYSLADVNVINALHTGKKYIWIYKSAICGSDGMRWFAKICSANLSQEE